MLKTSIECLPVEVIERIVCYLAVPPEWPYCMRSSFGTLYHESRLESIYAEPINFWKTPFPVGLLALSRVSKRYRDICRPFINSAQVVHQYPIRPERGDVRYKDTSNFRYVRLLQVRLPKMDYQNETWRSGIKQPSLDQEMLSHGVSHHLRNFGRLTSLQLHNVPLSTQFVSMIKGLKNLKALVIAYHFEWNTALGSRRRDLGGPKALPFERMPPLEELYLLHPTARIQPVVKFVGENLRHLHIERGLLDDRQEDNNTFVSILDEVYFPRLRHFTLISPYDFEPVTSTFISRHRKTLREVNLRYRFFGHGNLRWILRAIKTLSDVSDFDAFGDVGENSALRLESDSNDHRWYGQRVLGFGCAFRDCKRDEGKELLELGLLMDSWPFYGHPAVSLRTFFQDEIFRTLQKLRLRFSGRAVPPTASECLSFLTSACGELPSLQALSFGIDYLGLPEIYPDETYPDETVFYPPVIPELFERQVMNDEIYEGIYEGVETDDELYEGIDWQSNPDFAALHRMWEMWEDRNYPFVRHFIYTLMKVCRSLETIEWFFGRHEETVRKRIPQALWLWRKVKQRSKRGQPVADGTTARTFIVGDLMLPGTPRESRRLCLTPFVGRAGDFEARLL